jgi:hypothetical protein
MAGINCILHVTTLQSGAVYCIGTISIVKERHGKNRLKYPRYYVRSTIKVCLYTFYQLLLLFILFSCSITIGICNHCLLSYLNPEIIDFPA